MPYSPLKPVYKMEEGDWYNIKSLPYLSAETLHFQPLKKRHLVFTRGGGGAGWCLWQGDPLALDLGKARMCGEDTKAEEPWGGGGAWSGVGVMVKCLKDTEGNKGRKRHVR